MTQLENWKQAESKHQESALRAPNNGFKRMMPSCFSGAEREEGREKTEPEASSLPVGKQWGQMGSNPGATDSFFIWILIENSMNGLLTLKPLDYIPRPIDKNLSSFNYFLLINTNNIILTFLDLNFSY